MGESVSATKPETTTAPANATEGTAADDDARTAATLARLPLLLPTAHSAVRRRLTQWF